MKKTITSLALIFTVVAGLIVYNTGLFSSEDNVVKVYCYGDYIDPDIVTDFQEETGIKVVYDTFDTNEEMYPVIKNHAGDYDVICPSDYMIERMIGENLLAPLDKDSIKNYGQLDEAVLSLLEIADPENKYAVPYQWGTMGILYDTKMTVGKIDSWSALWDEKYKGSIVMMDSIRDTLGVALKKDGKSINTKNKKDLADAVKALDAQKPLVYKYANDSARDLVIGESAALGVVWNGEYLYSKNLNSDLDFVVPKEGSEVFVDAWVIPKTSKHKSNGEKWIDYMCRPDVAYKNFLYLSYSTPNKGARELMDQDIAKDSRLFPSQELLEESEVLKDLPPEINDMYSRYWKEFKSN